MVRHRSNLGGQATANDCFTAMQRHHERGKTPVPTLSSMPPSLAAESFAAMPRYQERSKAVASLTPPGGTSGPPPSVAAGPGGPGDIIYGARAIARFLFGEDDNKARRRVFNLWAHYRSRRERAGFFKLKGALCLSKTLWRTFHGLG